MKRYTGNDPEILFKNYEAGYRVFGAGIIAGKFSKIFWALFRAHVFYRNSLYKFKFQVFQIWSVVSVLELSAPRLP